MTYPESALELVGQMEFPEDVIVAMKDYRSKHIWKIPLEEKIEATRLLFAKLCSIYNLTGNIAFELDIDSMDSFSSRLEYEPVANVKTIRLIGKFSVITFLHEFAHLLLGSNEKEAVKWSVNLFKLIFPRSFSRLQQDQHCMVQRPRVVDLTTTNQDTI